ncbi:MAG: hypothetical protein HOH95_11450, partial [Dehalococcoidia bacterium]|nr:hypothetical protein [Dehalococcoidia bacterium]
AAVVALLRDTHPQHELLTLTAGRTQIRDYKAAVATFEAMCSGVPIIHQAVLWDAQHLTYGAPDLLVRSDILPLLIPDAITAEQATTPAPDLGTPFHYLVVDIKFSTLHLSATGELTNSGSATAYKSQLHIYNRALGNLQGHQPPDSFLLGRSWEQRVSGDTLRGSSCLDRLAPVPQAGSLANKIPTAQAVEESTAWLRRARTEGASWDITPTPTVPQLYPNMGNDQDAPWHVAKKQLAEALGELTLLWQVGARRRNQAHEAGITDWRDPACTPTAVGITGAKQAPKLAAILQANRQTSGPVVSPAHIEAARAQWHPEPPLEFYVDFETVSDLADTFADLPQQGGQTLIYMIGCGHIEDGEWNFTSFTVDALSEPEEARIIDHWFDHMAEVRSRLTPHESSEPGPPVIHWSPAEVTTLDTAHNSARNRQPGPGWPKLNWFDFYTNVAQAEPVTVRGAMGFGLKDLARAMHTHGLIQTNWQDGPADGLGAMVGAWWSQNSAIELGEPLSQDALMLEIAQYNEVDCKVMMEIVRYLRQNH